MADIIDLMLAPGARIGEVLALHWIDVDLDGERPTHVLDELALGADEDPRAISGEQVVNKGLPAGMCVWGC